MIGQCDVKHYMILPLINTHHSWFVLGKQTSHGNIECEAWYGRSVEQFISCKTYQW